MVATLQITLGSWNTDHASCVQLYVSKTSAQDDPFGFRICMPLRSTQWVPTGRNTSRKASLKQSKSPPKLYLRHIVHNFCRNRKELKICNKDSGRVLVEILAILARLLSPTVSTLSYRIADISAGKGFIEYQCRTVLSCLTFCSLGQTINGLSNSLTEDKV